MTSVHLRSASVNLLENRKKYVLSLLSPRETRPENSCSLAVYSNLETLLQTLWFTAGLKHFQLCPRIIKKQVESDEFGDVMPERGPEKEIICKSWWWLFQISKTVQNGCSLFYSAFKLMSWRWQFAHLSPQLSWESGFLWAFTVSH